MTSGSDQSNGLSVLDGGDGIVSLKRLTEQFEYFDRLML